MRGRLASARIAVSLRRGAVLVAGCGALLVAGCGAGSTAPEGDGTASSGGGLLSAVASSSAGLLSSGAQPGSNGTGSSGGHSDGGLSSSATLSSWNGSAVAQVTCVSVVETNALAERVRSEGCMKLPDGRLARQVVRPNGSGGQTLEYIVLEYDGPGRLVQEEWRSDADAYLDKRITYGYDGAGRCDSLSEEGAAGVVSTTAWTYDAFGTIVEERTLPTGGTEQRVTSVPVYSGGRLASLMRFSGTDSLDQVSYERSGDGRPTLSHHQLYSSWYNPVADLYELRWEPVYDVEYLYDDANAAGPQRTETTRDSQGNLIGVLEFTEISLTR